MKMKLFVLAISFAATFYLADLVDKPTKQATETRKLTITEPTAERTITLPDTNQLATNSLIIGTNIVALWTAGTDGTIFTFYESEAGEKTNVFIHEAYTGTIQFVTSKLYEPRYTRAELLEAIKCYERWRHIGDVSK